MKWTVLSDNRTNNDLLKTEHLRVMSSRFVNPITLIYMQAGTKTL